MHFSSNTIVIEHFFMKKNVSLFRYRSFWTKGIFPFCSGKSSLGIALFRLSEAASGAIYIDDINIRDIKLSALRSRISILVQDPVLFVGTIRYIVSCLLEIKYLVLIMFEWSII